MATQHIPTANGTTMNGATSLVKSLEAAGVDVMFGLPGGAILPAYDPIFDSTIRHILVRHEQGAGHAATGYAQVTGRAGVCIATSGPGATNLVTPLMDAGMDSVPLVAITGQVPSAAIGTDAFQEADIRGITMPFTKHNFLVTKAEDIPRAVAEAFHIATSGRPGPVLVDVAKDALQAQTTFNWPEKIQLAGYNPRIVPDNQAIADAAALIAQSKKPVFYVGGGVIKANASRELAQLVELLGAPVVTTLMARGAFPDSHPLHLGMPGMHGSVAAVTALQKADLLITLGARFDDRVTGKLSSFAVNAKIIHADIDPAEINKNKFADVPVIGDLRETITALIPALKAALSKSQPDLAPWNASMLKLKSSYPVGYTLPEDGSLSPQAVIERIGQISGTDTIFTSGVGQHQMWASQFIGYEKPRTWLNSGGLGTMGVGLPYAMGAQLAHPEAQVACITGEASIQMCIQELSTCKQFHLPVKIINLNNRYMGMVRQWQEFFYGNRYAESYMDALPDFVKLAESYGHIGLQIEKPSEVTDALKEAFSEKNKERLVFLDFLTDQTENVYPMVPNGKGLSQMILSEDL